MIKTVLIIALATALLLTQFSLHWQRQRITDRDSRIAWRDSVIEKRAKQIEALLQIVNKNEATIKSWESTNARNENSIRTCLDSLQKQESRGR